MSSLVASRHTTSFPTLLDYLGETRWEGRPSPSTPNPALFYAVDDEGPILGHILILMELVSAGTLPTPSPPIPKKLLYVSGRRKKCQDLRLQGPNAHGSGALMVLAWYGTRFWFVSTLATKFYRFCAVFPSLLSSRVLLFWECDFAECKCF